MSDASSTARFWTGSSWTKPRAGTRPGGSLLSCCGSPTCSGRHRSAPSTHQRRPGPGQEPGAGAALLIREDFDLGQAGVAVHGHVDVIEADVAAALRLWTPAAAFRNPTPGFLISGCSSSPAVPCLWRAREAFTADQFRFPAPGQRAAVWPSRCSSRDARTSVTFSSELARGQERGREERSSSPSRPYSA